MDPICAAALATAERQGAAFDAAIAGLPDEAMNWQPGPDTNSLAVLVVHAWGSARMWTARASGRDATRDRAAEFRVAPTGDEARAVLAGALADVRASVAAIDPGTLGQEASGRLDGERVTRARCLIHALEHTQEHLGQALLTRHLWEQGQGAATAENRSGYRLPEEAPADA